MKLKVTQIRSTIGRKEDQKRTIAALGLGKINRSRLHDDNPVIRGMITKVIHLIKVEEVEDKKKTSTKKASPKKADKGVGRPAPTTAAVDEGSVSKETAEVTKVTKPASEEDASSAVDSAKRTKTPKEKTEEKSVEK
jgi:large subunit ribosomal protein L30